MIKLKVTNKTPQPVVLHDGIVIFPKEFIIIEECRVDDQLKYFERIRTRHGLYWSISRL